MTMHVFTDAYVRSHGRTPRGRGAWMFEFRTGYGYPAVTFTANGSYTEAKKQAVAEARKSKAPGTYVVVMP